MRTITIRQLSINLFKELEDLPVEVTRYGRAYCVITGPIVGDGAEEPVKTVGPLSETPKAKYISKFKERIPISKEMEEKILNHGEIGSPRGELDIENYT